MQKLGFKPNIIQGWHLCMVRRSDFFESKLMNADEALVAMAPFI